MNAFHRRAMRWTFIAMAWALSNAATSAQAPPAAAVRTSRPKVVPVRVDRPPQIDGRLDEPVWSTAARITDFTQYRPAEGEKSTEKTEVYVAYDKDRLYFGIYAHYSDTSLMQANRVDRDQAANDDLVWLYFDPFQDQQRGYAFSVNGYGVQGDAILQGASVAGGQSAAGDLTWNALFQSAGVLVEDGWTAEIAIPIRSLRYPSRGSNEPHRWGFQILREIRGKNETATWSPVSTKVLGFLPQMGTLDDMRNLSTRRNFEVMPTVTALQLDRLDARTTAYSSTDVQEAGLNVKYGITPNLTADFTYNPDFSQIESDQPQIDVNQRFPLLFPELRPFFLEGQEIYQVPGPMGNLAQTRTIIDPQYGLKISGKVGRTMIGVLAANDQGPGKVGDRSSPLFGQRAQALVGRARVDIYSQSYLGVLFTNREFANSYSRVAFLDGGFRIGSSARSGFQVVYSDRRDLNGVRRTAPVFNVDFRKEGRNLTYFGAHNDIHPDFGSDLGFIRRVDQHQTVGSINYRWWPTKLLVNLGPGARYDFQYDYKGFKTDDRKQVNFGFQFVKNITLTTSVDRNMERFEGINFDKTRVNLAGTVNTSRAWVLRADMSYGDEVRFIANPYLGKTFVFNATIVARPSSRLQSQIVINTTRFTDVRVNRTDFDIKIVRALTTYQFTRRLLIRNISEVNTFNKTYGFNLLGTYRVNAGTVFFLGYDDRFRQGDRLNSVLFPTTDYRRTNRAVFAKVQYLYRY